MARRRRQRSDPRESPRGVFIDLERGLVKSVDSHGRRVTLRSLFPGEDPEAIAADLWTELDRLNPVERDVQNLPPVSSLGARGHLRLV